MRRSLLLIHPPLRIHKRLKGASVLFWSEGRRSLEEGFAISEVLLLIACDRVAVVRGHVPLYVSRNLTCALAPFFRNPMLAT